MKKVGIMIQKLSGGGAERAAANLSIDLSAEYEVHLIVFDGSCITYRHGGVLRDLALPARTGIFQKALTLLKRIKAVRRLKKEEQFDCVLSLLAGANLVNVLSRQKERVIVSERTLTSFFIKSIWEVALEKFILRKADCVVALSEVVRLDLIQKFKIDKNKVVTIYNSVALDKFCFDSSVEERDQDSPLIVTMGRLTHQKAQWHLFRAFPQVLKVFPGARLVVLGQGQLRDAYGDFLQKLGIDRQTELKGFLPNPHSVIRTADVFAFTSMVEGLGNALLEALACGKAVVSTDCDAGPREILAPETNPLTKTKIIEYAQYGVLVPATSNDVFDRNVIAPSQEETLLAEAIIRLLEDRSLRRRYEEKARERVADFSPAVITHGWVDVIEKD